MVYLDKLLKRDFLSRALFLEKIILHLDRFIGLFGYKKIKIFLL